MIIAKDFTSYINLFWVCFGDLNDGKIFPSDEENNHNIILISC